MKIKMENMCKDKKKSFCKFTRELNEEVLNRSFTSDKVYQYACTFKGKCVYVVYNGNALGNNNAYWLAQGEDYRGDYNSSLYSYSTSYSSYDGIVDSRNILHFDDLEVYDVFIMNELMIQSKYSYTLYCVKDMFGKKIYFKKSFKRDFSIEEAKRVLEKFDEKNSNLKLTEIDTNLYYAQVGNHEEYRSILYKNGEDMICFYIFDKKHDSYYMYHNEDGWDKMEYGTFPPKITMAIKHSDICSIVYKHDVCDILKKIGNKKLTEIYYALFTDFDKMRKKAKGYVKRILYKKYDKLRKPLYENEYMTIKVRNPIGDCPGILYRRMGTYNDTSEVKIKSKEKDVLMLQKAHEVMAGITNEFQEDLKKRNVLEFEHGYVYLNGDNKKRFFIKTEKYGVVKTDENLPNRVSLRNESELVINTKKLLKEYEKKKNIMIRLLGKKEEEIFK